MKKNLKLFLFYGIFTLDIIAQISYFMFRFIILNDKDNKGKEQAEKEFHMIGFVATVINIMMYSSSFVDVVKMTKTNKVLFNIIIIIVMSKKCMLLKL